MPKPQTLKAMIRVGNYSVDRHVPVRELDVKPDAFAAEGLCLYGYHESLTLRTASIIEDMALDGNVPATVEMLLAYGVEHPEDPLRFWIIALGTAWKDAYGSNVHPMLRRRCWGNRTFPLLSRICDSGLWSNRCWFLAQGTRLVPEGLRS